MLPWFERLGGLNALPELKVHHLLSDLTKFQEHNTRRACAALASGFHTDSLSFIRATLFALQETQVRDWEEVFLHQSERM